MHYKRKLEGDITFETLYLRVKILTIDRQTTQPTSVQLGGIINTWFLLVLSIPLEENGTSYCTYRVMTPRSFKSISFQYFALPP
jgi:hypothetical protein